METPCTSGTRPYFFASPQDRLADLPTFSAPFEAEHVGTVLLPPRWRKVRALAGGQSGIKVLLVENKRSDDDLGLPRLFVVKCAKKDSIFNSGAQTGNCFQNEVRAALHVRKSGLTSPNVVRAFGAWQDGAKVYLAFEHCDGGELFTAYHSGGLDRRVGEHRTIVKQMLQAVNDLHKHGFFHQDICLENFLLMSDDTVKLADFGGACCCPDAGDDLDGVPHADFPAGPGKMHHMPPEFMWRHRSFDAQKVDVFQFGIAIFTLIVGTYPYQQGQQISLFPHAERNMDRCSRLQEVFRNSHYNELLPAECMTLIQQLMAPDPVSRPSADRALEHPWFSIDKVASEVDNCQSSL
mmetsp:Transcript_43041/g.77244  ORF Transcript_43041/g.77244 Transcript_43041/m.77244 type:complete len:351 (+) Transcript_43041:64-1116(+)